MSSIQTGIALNDQFSGVLYSIINSVNLAVSSMYDMQQSMNADIDTRSIEGAKNEIDQATAAINAMNEALARRVSPDVVPPVQWETGGLDVFTSTGVERFQQEIQSANGMLEQLSSTQDAIARQAFNTNLFPPEAFQDLNRLATRIDLVRDRIRQIENNQVNIGTDTANAELEQLRAQLGQAVQEQDALNQAMQEMDVSAANDAYLRLSQTIGNTERYIRDNVDGQGRFNQEIRAGTQQADAMMGAIKGAVAAYVSIQSVGKAFGLSDGLTLTTSRLDLMNDGVQSTSELLNMVYAAAQDARGSFSDMAGVVARFGNNAGDAFSSSEEVVAFADLVQKQMTIAGAGTQEAANAMLQLSQALGSGVLRGDELNSIFEQAPNLIQSIADYLDVPIGKIREMASEGELSADIVKAAIFASADEINAKFEQMPMTWGQVWQSMQNTALIAFLPVLQRLNQIANSDDLQAFVNGAMEAMATLANVILDIFDLVAMVGGFIADNWSVTSPVIYGVIAALAVYAAYLGIVKGLELSHAAASAIYAAAMSAKIGITAALTGSTMAATAAQMGYNGALYACPIVWIVVLVIALIAALVALCNWIAQATGAANSGIGIIVGALSVALAFIGNLFVALINMVIDLFVALWNLIAAFVNFFGNVFTDPVGAIARLFFDLADTILSLLQTLAGAIDAIFGSNLSGAVQGWRDDLGGWVDETFGQGKEIMATVRSEDWHFDRFEYGEAWDAGVAVGDGIAETIDNFSLLDIFGSTDIPDPQDYTSGFGGVIESAGIGDRLGDIAGNTDTIKDSLDVTEEDLKYLRDIAEQETVNRFTTAEISIDMSGMRNTVNSGDDIDGFMAKLTDSVNEAVDNMTEGVHE